MRRALIPATIACSLAFGVSLAPAGFWSNQGGDSGRSGYLPISRGGAPYSQLWEALGHDVRTSVVVGAQGPEGKAPRVVYGTADGNIHLRDLFTGQAIGRASGVDVSANNNKDVFSGFGGVVSPVIASGPDGYGQVYTVLNDRLPPEKRDPDNPQDEIAIAQIDEATGRMQTRVLVPGTEKFVISSTPVLSEPFGDGDRSLLFYATDVGEWEKEYGKATQTATPTLFRVPIAKAYSKDARIQVDALESTGIERLTPLASPTIAMWDNESGDQNTQPVPLVVTSSANPDAPIQTFVADRLVSDDFTFLMEVAGFAMPPPTSSRLDPDATDTRPVAAFTTSVPVAPSGEPPGTGGSGAGRAPALLVTTWDRDANATTVHRLVYTNSGDSLVEVARSAALPGRPAPQLATTQNGQAPGDSAGKVLVTTGRNLYALEGGDLAVAWKVDDLSALAPGSTGFSRTTAVATRETVFVARDDGRQLAFNLEDGAPLDDSAFQRFPSNTTPVSSYGAPALTPAGVVVIGDDKGVHAFRARCANAVRAVTGKKELVGTLAGDDIKGTRLAEVVDAKTGDDCVESAGGDDIVAGGGGQDRVDAGEDADRVQGGDDADHLFGGAGNDVLDGEEGNDFADGSFGRDSLKGGIGNDTLVGSADADKLFGEAGADALSGGSGADVLNGGNGPDKLRGGAGKDNLHGGNQNDTLVPGKGGGGSNGGRGDDLILASNGAADRIHCGPGIDTVKPDARDRYDRCEYLLTKRGRVALRRRR